MGVGIGGVVGSCTYCLSHRGQGNSWSGKCAGGEKWLLSCEKEGEQGGDLAVMTHLAGLWVEDPTRDGDGCGLVHEARLCDDAQQGHGRHRWLVGSTRESCELYFLFRTRMAERRIL